MALGEVSGARLADALGVPFERVSLAAPAQDIAALPSTDGRRVVVLPAEYAAVLASATAASTPAASASLTCCL